MQGGGVLGRLAQLIAQWLRGLARRLDRAAGGAAVPPPVLAALAERFPGAPEHWLADIARHMIEADAPLPGVDAVVPPMEAPPLHEPRARAARPVQPARRSRPALRLIGSAAGHRPAGDMPEPAPQRRPAKLRWLGSSPKTVSAPAWPDLPGSHRPQATFKTRTGNPAPLPDPPFEFRKAERRTDLAAVPERAAPEAFALPAIHSFADRTLAFSREGGRRAQETDFAAPPPAAQAEAPAAADFPTPVRIPVEFAPLRPAQRVSLSFPQAGRHRAAAEWNDRAGAWPALPQHQQDIDDAPSPASPLTDCVREQMAGRWSA